MAGQARRKSAAGVSTRDRLKAVARHLFAERGPSAVTVRDILTASEERNGASLNYYFTSKDALIREIVVDIFSLMNERWGTGLAELLAKDPAPDVRDLVRLLVRLSDTSDIEETPTTARLAHAFSAQDYLHIVMSVMKEHKLNNYDRVLGHIANRISHVPAPLVRQRLIFLTRYLSSMFALYETARIEGSRRQLSAIGVEHDQGNLIDTAVGLLMADAVDAVDPV